MEIDIEARLNAAKEIARKAGILAIEMRRNQDSSFTKEKSHQDFVTAADLAVEDLIRECISAKFPGDSFLGEEDGRTGTGEALWVVDPIDGTTNFMRGLMDWGVSIAFCFKCKAECAVIYAPDIDVLAWVRAGAGAFVDGQKIRVSEREFVKDALVLLGRSTRCSSESYQILLDKILSTGFEYRRNGSAAFSLLLLAMGRADAFYEAHLNPWDAMAGILVVSEAGGKVEYPEYQEFIERGGPVLASNSRLHRAIRSVIQDCKKA